MTVASQHKYTICFDAPEDPGNPIFAGWYKGTLGFAPSLDSAAFWDDEETAQRHLENGYGPSMREIGVVVEVPA